MFARAACRARVERTSLPHPARAHCRANVERSTLPDFARAANASARAVWTRPHSTQHPTPKIFAVGRLVDGYLTLVARDEALGAKSFQSLAEALPKDARYFDDNLYRAIDMYLKIHPHLTEEERLSVCRSLEYHRLSQEAREHVMKNNRLPLKIMTQFVLLEQVNRTRSMTASGSNYGRTKMQAIISVSKGLEKGWMNRKEEIKIMKKEVDKMKVQLNELQMCKLKLQRQGKICIN